MIKGGSHAKNISACETQNHNGRLTKPFLGSGARDYEDLTIKNIQSYTRHVHLQHSIMYVLTKRHRLMYVRNIKGY